MSQHNSVILPINSVIDECPKLIKCDITEAWLTIINNSVKQSCKELYKKHDAHCEMALIVFMCLQGIVEGTSY
jgi:hypothetical protein